MPTNEPTLGVGAICIQDGALLMVRRGREPGLGLWSLPGGRVEQGERLTDALRREVKEETGLDVSVTSLAGVFEVIADRHYVVIDYFVDAIGEAIPAPGSDADAVSWVPLGEIAALDCTPRLVETLGQWQVLPPAL